MADVTSRGRAAASLCGALRGLYMSLDITSPQPIGCERGLGVDGVTDDEAEGDVTQNGGVRVNVM